MSDPVSKPWTIDQFFAWQSRQTERYELVSGFPVRMMAGARNVHNDIVINILAELRARLRGSGCHPFNGDGSIETLPGQIRRPDAGADCGQRDPNAFQAALPRMVAEVLSPTTRDFDTFEKLTEYNKSRASTISWLSNRTRPRWSSGRADRIGPGCVTSSKGSTAKWTCRRSGSRFRSRRSTMVSSFRRALVWSGWTNRARRPRLTAPILHPRNRHKGLC